MKNRNYWVVSPNVKNNDEENKWKEFLSNNPYSFIGWDEDNQFGNTFINTIKKGDVILKAGDKIFAGGKQSGHAIELEIISDVNQSYLTQLWNNDAFQKEESELNALTNKISHYFTLIILIITAISAVGHAKTISAPKSFEHIARYDPP